MGLMTSMISGKIAQLPNGNYVMSDLRDIATIHVRVLENEASNWRRLTVSSDKQCSFMKIATKLKINGYPLLIDKRSASLLLKVFVASFNHEVKGLSPLLRLLFLPVQAQLQVPSIGTDSFRKNGIRYYCIC
jgi:dihydroflavonol-4-reductase